MSSLIFPDSLEIQPVRHFDRKLSVPGSKSLTNRALVIAALADGVTTLRGALVAEDSDVMLLALRQLGFELELDGTTFKVTGQGGTIPRSDLSLDLKLSGTSIRFLCAMLALGQGDYLLDGNERMRQRPIQDLLSALKALGVSVDSQYQTGCPPVKLKAQGLPGGHTQIAGDRSSQYLSALLMAAPYAQAEVTIDVTGTLQSKPFIDMTLKLMADFGVTVAREGYQRFAVKPQVYQAQDYLIEGDAMAAGYFWAAAAITGGRVRIDNLGQGSVQGDKRLAEVLAAMGCSVSWSENGCEVQGPAHGRLKGGSFDLNDMPDQAQTLAVIALFADSPVKIENVWNMRIKETDRLSALHQELRKFAVRVDEGDDFIIVHPLTGSAPGTVSVDTYGDHRMAMAFALAGLRLPGVIINEPACVSKTFPEFFEVLTAL